jgi:antitoxin MazE
MRTSLQRIGNSRGVIIPKPLLAQAGMQDDIDMTVEGDSIVLRKAPARVREGWAEDSKAIASTGDDKLVWPELANADDAALKW